MEFEFFKLLIQTSFEIATKVSALINWYFVQCVDSLAPLL